MLSLIVCRFLFFIFFGSLTLIRRANSDENAGLGGAFSSRDEDRRFNALRKLFPMEDNSVDAMKSLIYDGNIEKVVNILQNNVKQWSFIETQLLEPNVNVGMPEIFIPLKHLTTTLELLGNVFVSRNEYSEARGCLERACPLMELLPVGVLENDGKDDLQSVLAARTSPSFNKKKQSAKSGEQHPYAASCFSLLRDVYYKLYEKGGAMALSISSQVVEQFDKIYSEPKPSVVFVPVDHQINKKVSTSTAIVMTTDGLDPSKRPDKLQSLRMSKSNTVSNLVQTMKKIDEAVAQQQRRQMHSDLESSCDDCGLDGGDSSDSSVLTRDRSNRDRWIEQLNKDWIANRIQDLRVPYDHLRKEDKQTSGSTDSEGELDALRLLMKQSGSAGGQANGMHHSFILKQKNQQQQSAGLEEDYPSEDSLSDRTIRNILFGNTEFDDEPDDEQPSTTSHRSGTKSASSGRPSPVAVKPTGSNVAATSMIASDLEDMLRKFISGDRAAKAAVIKRARAYYDELDLQFPEMVYSEYAANMDLGQVFIDVMVHIVDEGVGYIGNELLQWSENNGGIREVDQDFFDSILLSDRNRLLVLSAFDVAVSTGGENEDTLMDIFNIFDIATAAAISGSTLPPSELLQRASPKRTKKQQQEGGSSGKEKKKRKRTSSSSSGSSGSGTNIDQESGTQLSSPSSGSSAGNSATLNRLEREVTAALYEEFLGNVDVAALRSSVPMLNTDNDWTLFTFYLVVIVSVVIVMQLLYVDAQKKRTRGGRAARSSNKRPVFGVALVDNMLHYFQPDGEVEVSLDGTSTVSGLSSQVGSLSSSSNPTTAAAADALTAVGTLLLYLYRFIVWLLSTVVQLALSAASASLSRVSPPAPPVVTTAPKTKMSSKLSDQSSALLGLVQKASDTSTVASASSSMPPSGHLEGPSTADDIMRSRLSDAALDNELAATFAEPSSNHGHHPGGKQQHNGKKQLSFSANLISPSVHVAAKNGVPIAVKKTSAMKQSTVVSNAPASSTNGKVTPDEGHSRSVQSTDSNNLVYVSKIAGKTIPLSSLLPQTNGVAAGDGEFITVNKEKKKEKPAKQAAPIVLPPAFNNIRIHSTATSNSSATGAGYGPRRTAGDVHSTEEKKASSLPNTPLNGSHHHNGFFADHNGNGAPQKGSNAVSSLPPPPPLRTVSKASPELRAASSAGGPSANFSLGASPLQMAQPVQTTSALQSLDYSLLSQSVPYKAFSDIDNTSLGSIGSTAGFGFDFSASDLDFSSINNSKAFVAPPPGIGSAAPSLFNPSSTFDQWSGGSKTSLFLDDFDYDDGVLQAADAFLDGLTDSVSSPLPPRSSSIISSAPASNAVYSSNTATAIQSLTPPRSAKPPVSQSKNIESESSFAVVYDGLSPDAPSFQPGKMYTTTRLQVSTMTSYEDKSTKLAVGALTSNTLVDGSFDGLYDDSLYADDSYDNLMSDLDGALNE